MLYVKDKHNPPRTHFLIVKTNALTSRPGHSLFFVEPFHKGQAVSSRRLVRRRISRDAGIGLEKLGHALEYLTDEFVHDGCRFDQDEGRLQAIQLLASLNRQIYFECGIRTTLGERVNAFLRRRF